MPALGFTERYHGDAWKVWAKPEPPLPATPSRYHAERRVHLRPE